MKIAVVGLGYVGLSNAVLLSLHNEVVAIDISQQRVDYLNARKSPIIDAELSEYLTNKDLNLSASTDLKNSVIGAKYVIVATPTNYDEKTNYFDTSTVEAVISDIICSEPNACIVVKSTIPIGFIDSMRQKFGKKEIIFSPEFLREGSALYDNLYPSRIIIGDKSSFAKEFAFLLAQGALKTDVKCLYTGTREAESIKLFANTYLAMRVAFFNELDTFTYENSLQSKEVIDGVCADYRIGDHYNNPSFGYGGYCLPKDTRQLLANFGDTPQKLITAIVEANSTRKDYLTRKIIEQKPKAVGVYKLAMKKGSDNFRDSAVHNIISNLQSANIPVFIHEPTLSEQFYNGIEVIADLSTFMAQCDIVITNRKSEELKNSSKVFTRDIFEID